MYNPSDKKGGVIRIANSGDWDTLDPGETYYGYSWNFARLYGRSLLTFKAAPGEASNELVPDLAEDLGKPSDDGKTWTYKIHKGVKFEDGTEVTSKDVAYAVARSIDKATFPNGPAYFDAMLDGRRATRAPTSRRARTSPRPSRRRTTRRSSSTSSSRSPASTTSRSSRRPCRSRRQGQGRAVQERRASTGPYKFQDLQPGK